jgi:hypothetical protein
VLKLYQKIKFYIKWSNIYDIFGKWDKKDIKLSKMRIISYDTLRKCEKKYVIPS